KKSKVVVSKPAAKTANADDSVVLKVKPVVKVKRLGKVSIKEVNKKSKVVVSKPAAKTANADDSVVLTAKPAAKLKNSEKFNLKKTKNTFNVSEHSPSDILKTQMPKTLDKIAFISDFNLTNAKGKEMNTVKKVKMKLMRLFGKKKIHPAAKTKINLKEAAQKKGKIMAEAENETVKKSVGVQKVKIVSAKMNAVKNFSTESVNTELNNILSPVRQKDGLSESVEQKAGIKPVARKQEIIEKSAVEKIVNNMENKIIKESVKQQPVKMVFTNKKEKISLNEELAPAKKQNNLDEDLCLKPKVDLKHLFKRDLPEIAKGKQQAGESKFFVSPLPLETLVQEDDSYELPAGYGDNRIVVQVRDPYWLYAYWEITREKLDDVRQNYNSALDNAKRVLRVYDISGVDFCGDNANKFFDIEINDYNNNWYINVAESGNTFCVDIGLRLQDGKFVVLARSNYVTMPIDGPSRITDEEWMVVEEDFNKLYGLSVGWGIGFGASDLRMRMQEQLSSGVLSSMGSSVIQKSERDFWLVVNTELIVYGATQPGAEVTIQGKTVQVDEYGNFSLRVSLPDGSQVIPVKAVSPDKVEARVITPIVNKKTEKCISV
ncbi:MAG: hypothetical protein DRP78_04930, partial [Candidatus Omnitrophota bacterium]